MVEYTKEELRQGRRRLRSLLPRLKAEARSARRENPQYGMVPQSRAGQNVLSKVRLDNLDALIVYVRGQDAWHADVVLKGMPVGVPAIFGTPASMPLASEAEASKAAVGLLRGIILSALDNEVANHDDAGPEMRHFTIHQYEFSLPAEMIESLAGFMAIVGRVSPELFSDPAIAVDQLKLRLVEMFGSDTFIPEIWDKASEDDQLRVLANVSQLIVMGHSRHPQREPEASPQV